MIRCSARLLAIWLLAIRCLLVLLLLSLFRTFSCAPAPVPVLPAPTDLVTPSGLSSSRADGAAHKGKCQFDLIDPSSSLEAESFRYQHLGCAHCEYTIRAPGSLVILLNFTDIHSLTDMSVELGAQQHLQETKQSTTANSTTKPPPPVYDSTLFPGGREDDDGTVPHAASTHPHPAVPSSERITGSVHPLNRTDQALNGSGSFAQHRRKNKGIADEESDLPDEVNHPKGEVNISRSNVNLSAGLVQTNRVVSHTTDNHNSDSNNNNNIDNKSDDIVSQTSHSSVFQEGSSTLHTHGTDVGFDDRAGENQCSLKLIIEVVNSSAPPQVICWQSSWQRRVLPLVYRYSVPVKVTYIWDAHSHSGFSLHFSFLQAKADVECEFHCNNHLCLLRDQLCNGYADCPDGADEEKNTCLLARQEDHRDSSSTQMKVIIIVSVIVLLLVIVSVFMISRRRHRHGARSGGRGSLLHPPHSQSSEVFRSTSSSMHDSGQYDALVQDSQRHQDTDSIAHCSESHHLLQQQQQPAPTGVCNPPAQVHRPHQQVMCPTNLERDGGGAAGKGWPAQQQHQHPHRMEPHVDKHQRRQPKKQPSPHDMYPPHIAVSGDGEEGYATAQRSLHSKQQLVRNWQEEENGVFRPPPNRTIYDCDAPPPPYSSTPPSLKSFDSAGAVNVLRPVRGALAPQSCTTPQCHSLSCHH